MSVTQQLRSTATEKYGVFHTATEKCGVFLHMKQICIAMCSFKSLIIKYNYEYINIWD